MLADYFGGVRETLILLPKKNGKTTLLAAVGLFHLATTEAAACYIGAASRDQATILFRQAAGYVRRSEYLQEHFKVQAGYRRILSRRDGGELQVMAADASTGDGVIPTLALVDELHRHKSADLYGVFRDGLGPRKGQMVTISTAGDDDESPLGRLRKLAYAQPGMVQTDAYRYVRSEGFAMHEWALEPDADRDDLPLVKSANPAPWQTVKILAERHGSPSMTSWQWARFACGVWLAGEESAITDKEWRACAKPGQDIEDGAKGVIIGVDLAWKWDTAAYVPIWRPDGEDRLVIGAPVIITPPGDGTSIPAEVLWEPIEEMAQRWPQATFVLDPNAGGEQIAQRIDSDLPARVATHPQAPQTMALAAQRLSEAISAGLIEHPDHPGLNAHVLSAAAKPVGEGWRFVKQRRKTLPIDGVIALAMGVSTILGTEPEAPHGIAVW